MMKKLLFILNPRSGKGQIKNNLLGIVDTFIIQIFWRDKEDKEKKSSLFGRDYGVWLYGLFV